MGKLTYLLPVVPLAYSLLIPWFVFKKPEPEHYSKPILRAIFFCISQLMMSGASLVLLIPIMGLGVLSNTSINGSSTALAPLFGVIFLAGVLILAFVSATILRYLQSTENLSFKTPWAPFAACLLLLIVQGLTALLAMPRQQP